MKRWLSGLRRPTRRAIPTRAGLFALASPIFLGVAAVNASNNLLFILLGALLGSIVLSGILSERNMKGVRVVARLVSPAYAGENAKLLIAFERPEDTGPAFALGVREIKGPGMISYFLKLQGGLAVNLPLLEGRKSERIAERKFAARGRAKLNTCELMTRYPFGLLIKARDAEVDVDVWVRPRKIAVPRELADPRNIAGEGDAAEKRGIGLDLYGLRERDDRDSMFRVHALRSLTLGKDVVVETAGVERPQATLGIASFEGADREAFERALEVLQATILAWDERGYAVGLETPANYFVPGEATLDAMFDHLARLELSTQKPRAEYLSSLWIVPEGARAPASARAIVRVGSTGRVEVA
jgi:uncharacterized protein (DUF58 family)